MFVNNLLRVVTLQCTGLESNGEPCGHQYGTLLYTTKTYTVGNKWVDE